MLRELHIRNLAVIEDVVVTLEEGLNCFTGQTGAGKSLILGAFEILLGLRSGSASDMIRPGAREARVSGVFELTHPEVVGRVLALTDLEDAGDAEASHTPLQLLITRKLFASGRTSVSINGEPATAGMVRAVGELLVDVHGQHDHQYLLKPSHQLELLDAYGGCGPLRRKYLSVYENVREMSQRHQQLAASRTLRRQQLDLYEFQASEIDDAGTYGGEFDELKARHGLLSNLRKIQQEASAAYAALHESEGSIVERLQVIAYTLTDLAEIDPTLNEIAEQVKASAMTLQDASYGLNRYADGLELDPQELAEVEERLNLLNRLFAKYDVRSGDDPSRQLIAFREQLEGELTRLRRENEDLDSLAGEIESLTGQLDQLADELAEKRRKAAGKLRPQVEAQLKELGMPDAQFEVSLTPIESADDGPSATGRDAIEIMVRTNPGQPARPLRKIASGGELSRVMLALKAILAGHDRISVLVFDEIDANIGGRMGTVIGRKMRQLTRVANDRGQHQVLCITHLPQIAAFADQHLRISKTVSGKAGQRDTRTSVTALEGEDRIQELSEMMAGKDVTDTTRQQAAEMLEAATREAGLTNTGP